MTGPGDERAVTVQIGAVLLLAIFVAALALYQVNAVPAENERVELEHNENVRTEMQEVRNAVQNAGTTGATRSASVTLGTSYPTRTFLSNPSDPSGRLETTGDATVTVENLSVESADGYYERGGERVSAADLTAQLRGDHATTTVRYEPDYNEYRDAPETRIEHGATINDFGEAAVGLTGQPVIDGDRITLVLVDGEIAETGTDATTVDARAISGPSEAIDVEPDGGPITVSLPTAAPAAWNESIGTDFDDGEARARVADYDGSRVEVELAADSDAEYSLRVARVGVGESAASDPAFDVRERAESTGSTRTTYGWTVETDDDGLGTVHFTDDGTADGTPLWDLADDERPVVSATPVSGRDDRSYSAEIVDGSLDGESVEIRTWRSTALDLFGDREQEIGSRVHVTATVPAAGGDSGPDDGGGGDDDSGPGNGGGGDDDGSSARILEPAYEENVDGSGGALLFDVDNTGEGTATVTSFSVAVDGNRVLDNGDSSELRIGGQEAANRGGSGRDGRFDTDGGTYAFAEEGGSSVGVDPSGGPVKVEFRGFEERPNGPTYEVDEGADLAYAESASDADVAVRFGLADGEDQTFYFERA